MSNNSWKQYGGVSDLDNFNFINANTIIADQFVSRSTKLFWCNFQNPARSYKLALFVASYRFFFSFEFLFCGNVFR